MGLIVRGARLADRSALYSLWDECFHDEQRFMDWFFDERFLPEFCSVAEIDGVVASVVHGLPVSVRLRDTTLSGIIAGGVATGEAFRGKGLMRRVLTHFMARARENGFSVVPHRPAALKTFFSIGHFPVSRSAYFSLEPNQARPDGMLCDNIELFDRPAELYALSRRFCANYSGVVERSYADFTFKLRDYLSCGAKALTYSEKGELLGYSIYFNDEEAYGEETCALNERAYYELCRGLCVLFPQKRVLLRVPADAPLPFDFGSCEVLEKSVMGAANIQTALKASGLSGGAVRVIDEVVPENCGVFDLSGEKTDRPAQLELPAGRLLQWLTGYKSIRELADEGLAGVLEPEIIELCDRAKKRPCYIIEEY